MNRTPPPVVNQTPPPVVNQTPTPAVNRTPTPVVNQTPPPVVNQTPPPVVKQNPPPVAKNTPPPVTTPPVVVPPPPSPGINVSGISGAYVQAGPLTPYSGGAITNGVFTGAGFRIPLATNTTTEITGTSPSGAVTGTTYVAADGSFFYANMTPVSQRSVHEFIYGGTPVNPQFYEATANTPGYLAFNVQPDAALKSSIPFIRPQTGGSLGSSASVSPLILATPLNTKFSTITGDTKAMQASLAVIGAGSNQQSVIVVLVGSVLRYQSATMSQMTSPGTIHGSYMGSASGQPVRINSYYEPPLDKANNRFYGSNSISGFALAPGATAPNATEVNTATQSTTATYQFVQPVTATSVPQAVGVATANQPRKL